MKKKDLGLIGTIIHEKILKIIMIFNLYFLQCTIFKLLFSACIVLE
jgi:hypothetical protein